MAGLGGSIELPSADDIVGVNASLIKSFGGFRIGTSNLRPDGPGLDYLLAAIAYPVFGVDLFPTVVDKAAFAAQYIITRHPFHDTNKRTGMEVAIELLELNGFVTRFQPSEIVNAALAVDRGSMSFDELRAWILRSIDPC